MRTLPPPRSSYHSWVLANLRMKTPGRFKLGDELYGGVEERRKVKTTISKIEKFSRSELQTFSFLFGDVAHPGKLHDLGGNSLAADVDRERFILHFGFHVS